MKAGVIMKKMMKKLTAALLALACIPVSGITGSAAFDFTSMGDKIQWDTMEYLGEFHLSEDSCTKIWLMEADNPDSDFFLLVTPRTHDMRFILRDDVDLDEGAKQVVEILDAYLPGLSENADTETRSAFLYAPDTDPMARTRQNVQAAFAWNRALWGQECVLYMRKPSEDSTFEWDILFALARRHLISEFYGWGETADAGNWKFDGLDKYPTDSLSEQEWGAVQNYLTELDPAFMIEQYEAAEKKLGEKTEPELVQRCRINGTDAMTKHEQIELAFDLWKEFGLEPCHVNVVSAGEPLTGHNALEQPGDTNLECEVDILDVIAANKHILGVGTLDKTGLKNADMDGNGTADSDDSLAILKAALDIDN